MTLTMSQAISPTKRQQAAKQASIKGENIAIIASEVNSKPVQMLFPISDIEKSLNRDGIEVIAIVDKNGHFVD